MSLELGLGEGHVRSLLENVKFRVELGEGQEQVCTRKCGVVSLSLGQGPGRCLLENVGFGA